MKYRTLTPEGDYSFGFGNASFVTDTEAVRQAIQTKLGMFKGEFWEDLKDGLPFFEQVAGNFNKSVADMVIRSRILDTPHVSGIQFFRSQISTDRKYSMTATVNTDFGAVSVGVS